MIKQLKIKLLIGFIIRIVFIVGKKKPITKRLSLAWGTGG